MCQHIEWIEEAICRAILTDVHARVQSELHPLYVSFRNLHSYSADAVTERRHLDPPDGLVQHQYFIVSRFEGITCE